MPPIANMCRTLARIWMSRLMEPQAGAATPVLSAAIFLPLGVLLLACCTETLHCSHAAVYESPSDALTQKMYLKNRQLIAALLLCAASPVWALELQQQTFTDEQLLSAVVAKFKKSLTHRFNTAGAVDPKPLVVLGPKLKFGKKMTSQSFTHLTQQELVAQQQAVFILINKAYPDPEHTALFVEYDIPSNASFGILKVHPKAGVLIAETTDSFRSSSGARATYGKLYEGVACRDDSEMAYRWNYYERNSSSGRCLDTMFTEFTGWFEPSSQPAAK